MLEVIINKIPLSVTTQALILGVTIAIITYQLLKKKYKLPPGPYALPLLGNVLSLRDETPLYKKAIEWSKVHGPVITIRFGPIPVVFVNSAETIQEVLITKSVDFGGRPKMHSMETFTEGYKNIVFADISPAWKILRKVALQGLRQYLSGSKLEEKVFDSALKVMKEFRAREGELIDIEAYISLMIFNMLNGVCFNKSFEMDDEQLLKLRAAFDVVNTDFGNGLWEDVIPPLRWCPSKRFTRILKGLQTFLDFIKEEYRTHKEKFTAGELADFTDYMINAHRESIEEDKNVESVVTDNHICHTISDVFSAGVDTSRQTIVWTLYLLIQHPDIQKKVQDEVDQVLDLDQVPSIKDRDRLSYTEAVLHESMRICPVAPMGVPHCTLTDTTLHGYDVPKGVNVMINHYALHHDPAVWHDPEVFRPERLLDEDGKIAPKSFSWLPFSAGRRNCLGETIARPELHLILALLVRHFTFKCADGETLNMKPISSLGFAPPTNKILVIPRK